MKILKGEYSFLILRFQIKCECSIHALLTIVLHSVSQSSINVEFSYKCEVLLSALETVSGIPVHLFVFKINWNLRKIPTHQFEHC